MARTILVVDDVAFVRKTLIEILSKAHYQVVGEAENGLEALEKYSKLRPDLVTMDVVMPQMSGIEATRKIVRKDKDAKIIIVTAMGHESLIAEAINAGARDYILKPFSTADILKTLDHIFSGAENLSKHKSL
jgi:two-component system chemotaxis response regulator CheY